MSSVEFRGELGKKFPIVFIGSPKQKEKEKEKGKGKGKGNGVCHFLMNLGGTHGILLSLK